MRAALVGIDFGQGDFTASVEELQLLARSAGANPVTTITAKRSSPDAAYFVGSGKADEIGGVGTGALGRDGRDGIGPCRTGQQLQFLDAGGEVALTEVDAD